MKRPTLFILCLILLAACSQTATSPTLSPPSTPSATKAEMLTPITEPSPTPPAPTLTATEQTTADVPIVPSPMIYTPPRAPYDVVFQIPVEEDGVRYQGVGVPEMQITGPNGLAVLPDGTFVIADPLDNRLLRYSKVGNLQDEMDLYDRGIVNVSDLVATTAELYLLEISFSVAPARYRVSRLSFDGELIAQYDIPAGHQFEDGLYGLAPAGSSGEILLEFYGMEMRYYQLADLQSVYSGDVEGIPAYGRVYRSMFGSFEEPRANPAILVDGLRIESPMTLAGLIKVLAVNPDGTFYVIREDMVSDYPVIQGDITVHFISGDGLQLAAARYPLSEWLFFVQRPLAVGWDGNVYALLPRTDTLDILRLNFTERIDPLIPGAVEPYVGRME